MVDPQQNTCVACREPLRSLFHTKRLLLRYCPSCGTFKADHHTVSPGEDIWQSKQVTPEFLAALALRRSLQAEQILTRFDDVLRSGNVLDYGCGQGVFLKRALARGIAIVGCDLAKSAAKGINPAHFTLLDHPWSFPDPFPFSTVVMLDVFEHCDDPEDFVQRLYQRATTHLIMKVPLASGPLFQLSKGSARLGRPGLIERLFLVGDIFPHLYYYTPKGLARFMKGQGYRMARRFSIQEIGSELPSRIRHLSPRLKILRPLIAAAGVGIAAFSSLWSDSAVFLFEREENKR